MLLSLDRLSSMSFNRILDPAQLDVGWLSYIYAGDFIVPDIELVLNICKICLITSCEALHYQDGMPVDMVFPPGLWVILMAAT